MKRLLAAAAVSATLMVSGCGIFYLDAKRDVASVKAWVSEVPELEGVTIKQYYGYGFPQEQVEVSGTTNTTDGEGFYGVISELATRPEPLALGLKGVAGGTELGWFGDRADPEAWRLAPLAQPGVSKIEALTVYTYDLKVFAREAGVSYLHHAAAVLDEALEGGLARGGEFHASIYLGEIGLGWALDDVDAELSHAAATITDAANAATSFGAAPYRLQHASFHGGFLTGVDDEGPGIDEAALLQLKEQILWCGLAHPEEGVQFRLKDTETGQTGTAAIGGIPSEEPGHEFTQELRRILES